MSEVSFPAIKCDFAWMVHLSSCEIELCLFLESVIGKNRWFRVHRVNKRERENLISQTLLENSTGIALRVANYFSSPAKLLLPKTVACLWIRACAYPCPCRYVYKLVSCKVKSIRRSIAFPPRSLGGRGTCDLFRWPIYKLRDTARRCNSKWKIEPSPGSFARRAKEPRSTKYKALHPADIPNAHAFRFR